ncbi:hypothetical protein [Nostoc sp. UHCC 0252]|uniref:hypothetical protein n=1 Tax=Nostoc sp. UHCC 0252 TaxID=3110241 RepID=UPI002B21F672|nr:hypothetical protein [Nostoc sp. UHCC 0252]MEA5599717.1 hypothetical protein [Nostoc sp. UHCC 0252]
MDGIFMLAALAQSRKALREEPCSFHGRTPACVLAIAEDRHIAIYVSMVDPGPRNNGRGLDRMIFGLFEKWKIKF